MAPEDEFSKEFFSLLQHWEEDIVFLSDVNSMMKHEAFLKIVDNIQNFMPLILSELKKGPSFTFLVLEKVYGNDINLEYEPGNIDSMQAAWMKWANEQYLMAE